MSQIKRRDFIKTASAGAVGISLSGNALGSAYQKKEQPGKRVGIIGLDTSHATAFTKALNDTSAGPEFSGYRVTAAYPKGSNDIRSSVERIPAYIEEVKKSGVEIVNSIDELLKRTDYILLETNDGRLHLEQAVQVMKAGKTMFIDKPVAASLADAVAIYKLAARLNVPVFSSSSLRYIPGADEVAKGLIGQVVGADTFSPATLEETHPDLFWYGIHGVETLFTVMGTGCLSVSGTFTDECDHVTGMWNGNRIGTFRGIRKGKSDYGGIVFGEKGIMTFGKYSGYNALLAEIIKFFNTGTPPVSAEETTEIFAFMQAAFESKKLGGATVLVRSVLKEAEIEADIKVNAYRI